MKIPMIVLLVVVTLFAFSSLLLAQIPTSATATAHTPDLSGIWQESSATVFELKWSDPQGKPLKVLPMTPWGQKKFNASRPIGPNTPINSNDPRVSCLPPGVPMIYTNAFPMETIQTPGRVMMFFEYDHYVRQIFTDGRDHPKNANPTWMGDSIGRWEGDTLVVDTTGFNDKTWLDNRGHPHSDALHVVERIRRVGHNTLTIDITVEDPKAYTMSLKAERKLILQPGWNIMEFICEDNMVNFLDYEKKMGAQGKQTADVAIHGNSQPIRGDWSGTVDMADSRSLPATASFTSGSSGTITVSDPSGAIKYQLENIIVSVKGTITGNTADGTNLLARLSQDRRRITGNVVLSTGTGHKISLSRP
jgi:hypothetical protein